MKQLGEETWAHSACEPCSSLYKPAVGLQLGLPLPDIYTPARYVHIHGSGQCFAL